MGKCESKIKIWRSRRSGSTSPSRLAEERPPRASALSPQPSLMCAVIAALPRFTRLNASCKLLVFLRSIKCIASPVEIWHQQRGRALRSFELKLAFIETARPPPSPLGIQDGVAYSPPSPANLLSLCCLSGRALVLLTRDPSDP